MGFYEIITKRKYKEMSAWFDVREANLGGFIKICFKGVTWNFMVWVYFF